MSVKIKSPGRCVRHSVIVSESVASKALRMRYEPLPTVNHRAPFSGVSAMDESITLRANTSPESIIFFFAHSRLYPCEYPCPPGHDVYT